MTPSRPSRFRSEATARLAAIALLLAAAALRFRDLGGPSFWYDEAYSWWVGTQVSRTDALVSSLREFVPPLTYFLWRVWAMLAGTTEFALRASSALPSILTVAALGAVTRRLTHSRTAGLAALALTAIAPPLVWASRELRMYGPLLAFVALGDLAVVEALLGPARHRRRWAWAWGAAATAALHTVVLAGFWLIGLGCFALLALVVDRAATRRQAIVRALWPPALAAALAFLPWLLPALPHLDANRGYWPGTLAAAEFFSRTVRGITLFDALTPEATALRLGIAIVAFAVLAPILLRPRRLGSYFALVTTLPPLLLASAVFHSVPKWNLQHTVIFAPGVLLGLASAAAPPFVFCSEGCFAPRPSERGRKAEREQTPSSWRVLTRRGQGWGGGQLLAIAAIVVAGAVMVLATGRLLTDPALAHDDWRGLVAYVQAQRTEGEVVIIETGSARQAWIYYGGDDGLLPLPDDPLLDVAHTLHYANTAPVLHAALARAPGAWVVGWLDHVTDPTDIVGTLLDDIGDSTVVPGFHGLKLRHYVLTRPPELGEAPTITAQPDAELLPDVRLWGVTLPDTSQPADSPIRVRAWWTIADPALHTGRCYLASVRVYDKHRNRWGQADGPAAAGDLRADRWPADTLVLGHYAVNLLPGAPSGTYTATLMLYELGAGTASTEITLGAFAVGRPSTMPVPDEPLAPVTPIRSPGASGPLNLLGLRVQSEAVHPCEMLQGWLFWEVKSPLAVREAVRIALGDSAIILEAADVFPAQWELGDRFISRFGLPIDCHALRMRTPVVISILQGEPEDAEEVASWAGPEVEIIVERAFEPPPNLAPAALTLGEGMAELLGYILEPERVRADEPFLLVLVWQAGTVTDIPYSAFVHVTPRGQPGPLAGQHDSWPAMGGKPTYTWVPGEVITDPHDLPDLPPGEYDIRIGMYGPDVVRLPLTHAGAPVLDDVFVLTSITVE